MQVKKQQLELDVEQQTDFKSGKEDVRLYIVTLLTYMQNESEVAQLCPTLCGPMDCSLSGSSVHGIFQAKCWSGLPFPSPGDLPDPGIEPRSPTLQADTLPSEPPGKQNAGLVEAQAGIKIARRNISNLRYADDTTLMAESEEERNSLLMKVKEKSGKTGLKLNIQKTKIMASGPVTSWQIDRETMETVIDFILRGSKITADGDCSHEIRRCLLLGRKAMTSLDSILKSRHYFPTKVHLVKLWFSSSHV